MFPVIILLMFMCFIGGFAARDCMELAKEDHPVIRNIRYSGKE